ncbi:MAG TPA: hypothetical protein VNF06_03355, partial [Candidatus Aquilonibacter sp.]|nr:hypothetical protein [Candidatus Aquilonibacter sp.]
MKVFAGIKDSAKHNLNLALLAIRHKDEITEATTQYFDFNRENGQVIRGGEIDFEATKRITKLVRKLNPSFKKVITLVSKSYNSQIAEEIGIEVDTEVPDRSKNIVIELNSYSASKRIEKILNHPEMKEFNQAVEMFIWHEIGHLKAMNLKLNIFQSGYFKIDLRLLEPLAQLYALGKVRDPIGAMAAFGVMCYREEKYKDTMEEFIKNMLDYWDTNIEVKV